MERKKNLGVDLEATGNCIQRAMKRKGYTAKEVASMMGLTYQSIWKWCKGETIPDVENLLILSRILDTTMDELIVSLDSLERKIDDIVFEDMHWMRAMENKNIMRENAIGKARMADYIITQEDGTSMLVEYKLCPDETGGMTLEYFKKIS